MTYSIQEQVVFSDFEQTGLAVPPYDIFKRIRGGDFRNAGSSRILRQVDRVSRELRDAMEIRAVYRRYILECQRNSVVIGNSISIHDKRLAHVLRPCGEAVVFVVTIGKEIDALLERAHCSSLHYTYLLNTAGSMLVERAAAAVEQVVQSKLGSAFLCTARHSPGYCDWPVSAQRELFSLLPGKPAGITLTPDCCMIPKKSISGIMGIGLREDVEKVRYTCSFCRRSSCPHRRIHFSRELA